MALDPYSRVFRPDMQANNALPAWQPMGGEDQGEQAVGATDSFVKLLKKRMAGGGAEQPDGSLPYEGNGMPSGVGTAGSKGGGMSSL